MLGGISTAAAVYLATERLLRPAFALALDPSAPPEARSLGIGLRLLLTWLLCSGVPILMVALIPVGRDVADPHDLVAPIWFAAAGALGLGFLGTKLATQAVASPVRQLRRAVDAVTRGACARLRARPARPHRRARLRDRRGHRRRLRRRRGWLRRG